MRTLIDKSEYIICAGVISQKRRFLIFVFYRKETSFLDGSQPSFIHYLCIGQHERKIQWKFTLSKTDIKASFGVVSLDAMIS